MPGNAHGIAIAAGGTLLMTRLDFNDVISGQVVPLTWGLGVFVAGIPVDVAITPDGHTGFVTLLSDFHVAVVDVASSSVIGTLPVNAWPMRALVTPDGNRIYVTTTGQLNDTISTLYDFDGHTHALIDTMVVGAVANGITYDSTRKRLYVSSLITNDVAEIDAVNDVVLRRIHVASMPQDVALSLDGSELWVATENEAGVQIYDLATGALDQAVPNTSGAFGLKMTPDGAQFYVARSTANQWDIVDAHSRQVVKTFDTYNSPLRIAFDSIGSRAIITEGKSGIVIVE